VQTVLIALGDTLILHAVPPVRIADGEASIGGYFVELFVVEKLKDCLKAIETMSDGQLLDALRIGVEFGCEIHRPFPRNSRIDMRMPSRSGMLDVTMFESSLKAKSKSRLN
jgi:hypothetical protein